MGTAEHPTMVDFEGVCEGFGCLAHELEIVANEITDAGREQESFQGTSLQKAALFQSEINSQMAAVEKNHRAKKKNKRGKKKKKESKFALSRIEVGALVRVKAE